MGITALTQEIREAVGNCTEQYLLQHANGMPKSMYAQIVIGLAEAICDWMATQESIAILGPQALVDGKKCSTPISNETRQFILKQAVRIEELHQQPFDEDDVTRN